MKKIEKYLTDPNVLNIYRFGSHVYGTNNEYSDEDFILICESYFDSKDINIKVFSLIETKILINKMDIQILECIDSPKEFILKETIPLSYIVNLYNLRTSISTITSNSWVKGKKKLTVLGDYDLNLAIKSIFHSLRILDYGIQIATSSEIYDFKNMNFVLEDLRKLSLEKVGNELWEAIDTKYRKLYNSKKSTFKNVTPKDYSEREKEKRINEILSKYNIFNKDLTFELSEI